MRSGLVYRGLAVLAGLLVGLLALELTLRAGGTLWMWRRDAANRANLRAGGLCRVLCLGGSTTAMGGADSYPSQLEEMLNASGAPLRFNTGNARNAGVVAAGPALQAALIARLTAPGPGADPVPPPDLRRVP